MALLLYRLGKFAYLNRFKVIAVWVLLLIGMGVGAATLSKPTVDNFNLPGLPSEKATDIVNAQFGGQGSDDPFTSASATIVFHAKDGKLTDPKNTAGIDKTIEEIKGLTKDENGTQVSIVKDPNLLHNPTGKLDDGVLTPAQRDTLAAMQAQQKDIASTKSPEQQKADAAVTSTVSPDGKTAKLKVDFIGKVTDLPKDTAEKIKDARIAGQDASQGSLQVEADGSAAKGMEDMGMTSELIGMLVAAIVLIITFASLVAWGLPLMNAIIAVPVALAGVMIATRFIELGTFPTVLTSMIGLAVTIDYALFIVSRFRHELRRLGATTKEQRAEAAGIAVGTAGSAVIFAGLTVIIALAALAFIGMDFLGQMGVAAAWGVLIAVIVALTLLPALLGLFGSKVFAGRVKGLHPPDTDEGEGRTANGLRWANVIKKVPVVTLLAGVAVLGILAIPMKDMQTALPSSGMSEKSTSERKAYDLTSDAWGKGSNGQLMVAVDGSKADPGQRLRAYAQIVDRLNNDPEMKTKVANAQIAQLAPDNKAATIVVTPKGGPTDQLTKDLVEDLRALPNGPNGLKQAFNMDLGVAGNTAIEMDISEKLSKEALPIYVAIVVGLAFLLLLVAFRSILVPLTAVLGFLLSVVATFGVTSAIFTDGALGLIDNTQPLVSFLPIFMIGIVFGLAMDYQVFLVSRMREEYTHTGDATKSVVTGVQYGARVVTAAAIIMISVFASFILNDAVFIKEIGFGLAAAVLFDAFVVRMVIIPSIMMLLGDAAWWLPKWLDRILPNVDIEGEALASVLAKTSTDTAPLPDALAEHDTTEVPVAARAGASDTEKVKVTGGVNGYVNGAVPTAPVGLPTQQIPAQSTPAAAATAPIPAAASTDADETEAAAAVSVPDTGEYPLARPAKPTDAETTTGPIRRAERTRADRTRDELAQLREQNKAIAAELTALRSDYRSMTSRTRLQNEHISDPTRFDIDARLEGPDGPLGRAGRLLTPHGEILTPAFIPVGTKATVKTVMPDAVADLGAQAVLANAYHLYLQPGPEIVEQAGGLGKFMNWDGPTFTDSGGFQVMSLGSGFKKVIDMNGDQELQGDDAIAEGKDRLSRVDDDGVTFLSHLDGTEHRFTPERSMQIQHQLGADIIFAFDELTTLHNTRAYQVESLERTRLWARRSLSEHNWLTAQRHDAISLWGVVQGAQYEDLRRKAARDLRALSDEDREGGGLGFGGYGIGGALEKANLATIVRWVNQELEEDKPKHLLGISEPDDIFAAVEQGIDTFDCVSPSRVARNGAIYSVDGRYNVTNSRFKTDFQPLDPETQNYTSQFSRAYIHHLFKAKEGLAATLATIHNEQFIVSLVAKIRQSMVDGTYWEFKEEFLGRYYKGTQQHLAKSD
ncbi:Queuine tRNA-ribosyltransferase OS=Tsukamurella paurometabola (strain ATCC 8368 / DSM / CCUG 35730 / CIP 100753 / JCM 10117 / KCTC 9821 / NBRC 16120 / NCIMB 702349 / NCTC 13040) OX=521096 GN=tgt PE=3 SV=1 [Tsukamurella paurometabola]|uniref:Queuine tRNA-ribosyltransferase n=2 Tax=Tsukamurella paurometabola TaxID=2061 RepID=D5UNC0_TSUPD|nr:queuine tRNA-ribosyltransferase [Tsukamurella paurometabola DSM 20162]SUP40295.1 Queuine tRNA-ribosyltransferase [Tsukamurella paurometabola]